MLVDDHVVVRTGLRSFLESNEGFAVVAEEGEGRKAIATALEVRPDLIIMDITMKGMDGLEATRELKKVWPECLVLCLTIHEDKVFFMEMLAAGASGYLTKEAAPDELVQAIEAVTAGHVYLQPALARWLLEDYQRLSGGLAERGEGGGKSDQPSGVGLEALSEREREVLELVARGLGNAEMGERLGLSPKTIARHRERIMKRLRLHSRTELVRFAIRTGLARLD
jgi:two-component system response regulator NreC